MPARAEFALQNSSLVEAELRRRLDLSTFDPTAMKLLYLDLIRTQSGVNRKSCQVLASMATVIADRAKEMGTENKADFFRKQASFWDELSGQLLYPSIVFV